jgi:hypothetical protein
MSRCCLFTLSLVAFLLHTASANHLWAQRSKPPQRAFVPDTLMLPVRPIVDAEAIPASDVTDQVEDNELVLGVMVGSQARAYPINMLTQPSREIVNDTLGGRSIAATW